MKKVLVIVLAVMLMGAFTAWAAQGDTAAKPAKADKAAKPAKAKTPKTMVAKGKIVSASDTELVLAEKVKGKEENVTYKLSADTKKDGDMAAGNSATVHYTMSGTDKAASSVTAKAPAAPKPAKTKTPKAPKEKK